MDVSRPQPAHARALGVSLSLLFALAGPPLACDAPGQGAATFQPTPDTVAPTPDAAGEVAASPDASQTHDAPASPDPTADASPPDAITDTSPPDATADASAPDTSPPDVTCDPDCAGRTCGDDGCGGLCGVCSDTAACQQGKCVSTLKVCTPGCATVADCVTADPPPGYGLANYVCDQGVCRYTGCHSDADCASATASVYGVAVCEDVGAPISVCLSACAVPADCALQSGAEAYSADNYACDAGVCVYLGCLSDAECAESFLSDDYACDATQPIPSCMRKCSAPEDCAIASPAYDGDNWQCKAGFCVYQGCNTQAECDAMAPGFVCTAP